MEAALLLPVVAVVLFACFGFWLWMLIDALRRPAPAWEAAGQNQIAYIVVIVVLGFIGALVCALVARPRLQQVVRL